MATDEFFRENLVSVILFGVTFAVVLRIVNGSKKAYKIPKGPPTLPFFGNALSLKANDDLLNQLNAIWKQYGSVYSLYLGRKLLVVVNGWEKIKEVIADTGLDFADRGTFISFEHVNPRRVGKVIFYPLYRLHIVN